MGKIESDYLEWFEEWAEYQHTGAISKPAVWGKKKRVVWPVIKFFVAFALIYVTLWIVMAL